MARKKGEATRYQTAEVQGQLSMLANSVRDGQVAEWTAMERMDWPRLLTCLAACDGGVMLRSSEQGQAIAVGAFLGGGKQWVTCRTDRELLAVLEDFLDLLEGRVGDAPAPAPTPKAAEAPKGS